MRSFRFQPALAGLALSLSLALSTLAALTSAAPAWAHDFKLGDIVIDHPFAYANPPGTTSAGAYLRALRNQGPTADRLVAASTAAAERIDLHEMQMDGNVMRMRELKGIELPARGAVTMGPGTHKGYHLMLVGLKKPLKEGERFKVTLQFEKAGRVDVEVAVETRHAEKMHHSH